jgi:hypothetical protein
MLVFPRQLYELGIVQKSRQYPAKHRLRRRCNLSHVLVPQVLKFTFLKPYRKDKESANV